MAPALIGKVTEHTCLLVPSGVIILLAGLQLRGLQNPNSREHPPQPLLEKVRALPRGRLVGR